MALSELIRRYDQVLVDLDGVLWVGDEATERGPEALVALREGGKGLAFLTNDARSSPEEFVRKLWGLGYQASVDEVITCGSALQHHLAETRAGGAAFVIGSEALIEHVTLAGLRVVNRTGFATRADVVVVAGHEAFDYEELRVASLAVQRGAELIGLNRDASYPMPDGPWPATGALLAAVEVAAGRTADVIIGKPEPPMFEAARDRLGPGRALMVGDRLDIDLAGALGAGLDGALVLSGVATAEDARAADPPPTHVAASFAALVLR